ncbi:TonB-dependent receptor domain-containing protein [Sphingomonas sp. MMS24-J13]|uniref:TonB-dependent receptor domain-containing protein n=1 Tax=Sphingomonas sp. MMS24-J13 TaxID=3238686 RepID=UPI00384CC810
MPSADPTQDIVVTGSRIARTGFTSPTPVTVVGAERLEARAITNVGEALNELPSFRALVTPATQQAAGGNIGARVLDLRGLGAARTLVLLDGKRFVPSTTTGTIDVNLIPSILVQRTEVVTGGASAAYGSDAVAGVVNFILDKKFQGFKGSVQYGESQRGDAKDYNVSLAYGTKFAEDRGHFIVGGEFDKNKGMGDCYTRSAWCPNDMLVGNSKAGDGGFPASYRAGPNGTGNLSQDGLVNFGTTAAGATSLAPRGITFNPGGTTRQYQYGRIIGNSTAPLFMIGGEGANENGYLQGIILMPPVRRITSYGHLDYEFSDALKANLDLSYGQVKGTIIGSEARDAAFVINRNNAFLPAQLAGVMDANNLTSVSVGRVFGDLGGSVDHSVNDTYRAVASLEGRIGGSWKWDAYYEYGRNKFRQDYTGDVIIARMRNATNAVVSNGTTVCAINADNITTNDDPSCVPFNLFGRGQSSAAARAYVAPSGWQTADTTENVVSGNVHGDLFQLPGGPLSIASGAEFRSDKLVGGADPLSAASAFWSFNGKAINGKIEVAEGYVEAVAPLLKDVPFAESLELNGAVRRTHYKRSSVAAASSTANATTWKFGAVWQPIPDIRFRATKSRDIRAPNISELFGPVTSGRTTIIDPVNGGQQIQINSLSGSNPALNPEKADTWTAGIVLSPHWDFVRSLRFSADYFDIKVKGAIATLGAQTVVQRCAAGATEFCPFVSRDSTNTLTLVQDVLQNVNQQVSRGIDFEGDYATRIGSLGKLDFRLLATHYLEFSTRDTVGVTDRVGQTGYRAGTTTGVPNWTADALIGWTIDRFTLTGHARFISRGKLDALLVGPEDPGYAVTLTNSVSSNRVAARTYFDLSGNFRVTSNIEIFGAINNLFDKDPPLAPSAQGGTNQVYFDPIGRYFKAGVRVRM